MGRQTATDTTDLLGISAGSDNVWTVNFADSKVSDSAGANGGTTAATVAQTAAPVQRPCAVCAKPLTRRQKVVCSHSCRAKRLHILHPRFGSANPRFKNWASRHPVVYVRRFKAANPEKARAHQIVARAVRKGLLIRPSECESCYLTKKIDAHHEDYAKPLVVQWLCRKCHAARDRQLAALRARAVAAQTEAAPAQSRRDGLRSQVLSTSKSTLRPARRRGNPNPVELKAVGR